MSQTCPKPKGGDYALGSLRNEVENKSPQTGEGGEEMAELLASVGPPEHAFRTSLNRFAGISGRAYFVAGSSCGLRMLVVFPLIVRS